MGNFRPEHSTKSFRVQPTLRERDRFACQNVERVKKTRSRSGRILGIVEMFNIRIVHGLLLSINLVFGTYCKKGH